MKRPGLPLAVALLVGAYVLAGTFFILAIRLFCWVAQTEMASDVRGMVVMMAAMAAAFLVIPLAIEIFGEGSR